MTTSAHLPAICFAAVLLILAGCKDDAAPSSSRNETPSSHERMRDALADIAARANEENRFVGEQRMLELRSLERLPSYAEKLPPDERWDFFQELGVRELRLGRETDAIEHLTQALELCPQCANPAEAETLTHYNLALAWLRRAETQNCCQLNTSDSCIVPIQGEGVHSNREGSENAMIHLLAVLKSSGKATAEDERLETHESARWLLNIAAMTLGEYPEGVPEEFRVPPEFFAAETEFPKFRNVSPSLDLDTFNLCGGAVVDDFDGDLDLDIITCTWDVKGQAKVFRNNADGSFTDVTDSSGLRGFYGGLNMKQADFDNDGDLDIFIMRGAWLQEAGMHPNSLLRNDGNLKFTDVTYEMGLAEPFLPTKTAAWADYDNDGDLDLYVGNETTLPGMYTGTVATEQLLAPCQLFRNDGDRFTDVASEARIADLQFSMGAVWGDFDNDRYPDLFLSLVGDNRLYRNNQDGTFTNVTHQAGVADPPSSFPTWFFDYDNDGQLDLFVGCNSGPVGVLNTDIRFHLMKLYRNEGEGRFKDIAGDLGLDYPAEPMGANFEDLNNDGWLDFYLATGNVAFSEIRPNVMFRNNAAKSFSNVTMAGGFGHLQKGHAVSFADIDNDGDRDVYVQLGGAWAADRFSDALFRNPGFENQSITLILEGRTSNRCAIGAHITATIEENGTTRNIHRRITSGSSFGANPLRQTLGLGQSTAPPKIAVYWPTSDTTQNFDNLQPGKAYRIIEGQNAAEELQLPQFELPD